MRRQMVGAALVVLTLAGCGGKIDGPQVSAFAKLQQRVAALKPYVARMDLDGARAEARLLETETVELRKRNVIDAERASSIVLAVRALLREMQMLDAQRDAATSQEPSVPVQPRPEKRDDEKDEEKDDDDKEGDGGKGNGKKKKD